MKSGESIHCKHEGELAKYVGSKITINSDSMGLGIVKFTQPGLVHMLVEEYKSSDGPALIRHLLEPDRFS